MANPTHVTVIGAGPGGYPAAFDEVHRLIETHGYGKVELAAARVLNF